jgi:hypothetical protein
MGTRINPGKYDCYHDALPDEPMFVFLGRDPDAPRFIRRWASHRRDMIAVAERPESDLAMCVEAEQCADEMEDWRRQNNGKWRR